MYLDCDLSVVFVLYVLDNENRCLMHPGHYSMCGTCVWCDIFGDSGHLSCITCI